MLKRNIQLPTLAGVANGKTALLQCPIGYRYLAVYLQITSDGTTGNTTLPTAYSGDIRVKLGGKVQRLHAISELNKLNLVNGAAYGAVTLGSSGAAGYGQLIPIYFWEPWRKSPDQAEFCAWPTVSGQQLEIEIDAGTPGAGNVGITAYALVDMGAQPNADKNGLFISKVYRSDFSPAAAVDITTLDKRDLYQALYIVKATGGTVTKAVLKADGVPVHEYQTVAANSGANAQAGLNVGQFDYEMVLDKDDPIQSGFAAASVRDFQLRIEQTGTLSGVTRVLVERIGNPD